VAREEMAPDVAATDVVGARHHHQVGIRPDRVERIELDAAQALQNISRPRRAATDNAVERAVRHEAAARHGRIDRDQNGRL